MQSIEANLVGIFKTIGDVQISPNSKHILYTLKSCELVRNKISTSLYLLNIEVGKSDQCAHIVCCAFLLVPQVERMCACVRAWRRGDIHTLDGKVKCVLHA
jgi:hypothetical protein